MFSRLRHTFASAPLRYKVGGILFLIVVILIAVRVLGASPGASTASSAANVTYVSVASVASLSSGDDSLSVTGTVKSINQATILSQNAGEIVSLSRAAGDYVSAGDVIGQLDNASERAAVVEAQGQYAAAEAALKKAQGTTAANSGITSAQAGLTAQNAKSALNTSLRAAYAAFDDAVHTRADALFDNPNSDTPTLEPMTTTNSQLVVDVENERAGLGAVFQDASAAEDASSSADMDARASAMLADAQSVEAFLSNIISVLNAAVPSGAMPAASVAAAQTSLAAARSEAVAAVAALTAAKNTYDTDAYSAQSAANSADAGVQGDINAAEASVQQARGSLDAAEAALQKTIIRSPISGTIVSLPVSQGDYVSMYQQVAVISNPNALYVDANVTPEDAKRLAIGNAAMIAGATPGTITFIAPAVDPTTGELEVKVGAKDDGALVDGEVVSLSLMRSDAPQENTKLSSSTAVEIPLNALKVTTEGSKVFTVSGSSTLVAHEVRLGAISGDEVMVSGLSPDMLIVVDARGLSSGQAVSISTSTLL